MKLIAFAVFDGKAAAYGVPFFLPAVGLAVRAFTDLANDPKTTVAAHPEDYTLFQIGEFDDGDGVLAPLEKHIPLGLASGYVKPTQQMQLPAMPPPAPAPIGSKEVAIANGKQPK